MVYWPNPFLRLWLPRFLETVSSNEGLSAIQTLATPDGKTATKLYVSGKNKERTLVGRDNTTNHIFNIDERLNIYRYGNDDGTHDQLDGYVFSTADGDQIKSFKKGLRALLGRCAARC